MPLKNNKKGSRKGSMMRRGSQGFTLVELMVVVAIVSVLAVLALPSYNAYALKSRFSEVIVATNPTKTAIAVCAATGGCVENQSIALGTTGPGSVAGADATLSGHGEGNTPLTLGEAWALAYLIYQYTGQSNSMSANNANNNAQNYTSYTVAQSATDPSQLTFYTPSGAKIISVPTSSFFAAYNQTTDTYWSTSTSNPTGNVPDTVVASNYSSALVSSVVMQSLPCVGGAGCSASTKYVNTVSYSLTGVITGTATSSSGLNAETFTLTPSYSSGRGGLGQRRHLQDAVGRGSVLSFWISCCSILHGHKRWRSTTS